MTAEDEKRFRLIIREEVKAAIEGLSVTGPGKPLCGEPDFLQRSAALDEQARMKEARLAERKAKKPRKRRAA